MISKAEYRQLGKSGLRVSVPILGAMSFGSEKWSPWVLPEERALPILKAAWDAGINTIDTANMYSNGVSEEVIATFMRQNQIQRKNIVLLTKIMYPPIEDVSVVSSLEIASLSQTREYVNQSGLSRAAIFNQTDGCLARLATEYIDLLQIHTFDAATPIEETMRALNDLVIAGKVRYLGACNLRAWQLGEMNSIAERNGWTPFSSIQVEHSLLFRTEEIEMFAYCLYKGVGVIAYSPLMNGNLARPLKTETARSKVPSRFNKTLLASDQQIIQQVENVATKNSWTMAQVALAWSCTKLTSPIVGLNSVQRVRESIVSGKALDETDIGALEKPYEYHPYRW